MYKSVVFVDFENIQKIDRTLIDPKTKIIVMVGLNQDNKAFEFARNLFNGVSSIELVKVNGCGHNALDIFIAFYIGRYFDSIKESEIIICSRDSDYDQLIKHLDGHGISIKRVASVEEVKKETAAAKEAKQTREKEPQKAAEPNETEMIMEYLRKQTSAKKSKRPKKIATLENHLYSHFSQKISLDKIKTAIEFMKNNEYIAIVNNRIRYNSI
jgi:hypothetical protein